jgi:hypothetical protein
MPNLIKQIKLLKGENYNLKISVENLKISVE